MDCVGAVGLEPLGVGVDSCGRISPCAVVGASDMVTSYILFVYFKDLIHI